jgi:DNA repair protein RecO (recombination protein O)
MLAELATRFVETADQGDQFDALATALDHLDGVAGAWARVAGIAAAWQLIAAQGFAPSIDQCARCHDPVDTAQELWFSHTAGGIICERCDANVRFSRGEGRLLPGPARHSLREWLAGALSSELSAGVARAHTRLLHEFLLCHLSEAVQLRAFSSWTKRFQLDSTASE